MASDAGERTWGARGEARRKPGFDQGGPRADAPASGAATGNEGDVRSNIFQSRYVKIGAVIVVALMLAGGLVWWLIARNMKTRTTPLSIPISSMCRPRSPGR